MKIGVAHKLFLAIVTAAVLSVISAALIMQWNLNRGFLKFINSMEQSGVTRLALKLEELYAAEQSWEFLRRDPARFDQLVASSLPDAGPPRGEHMHDGPPPEHIPGENRGPFPPHLPRHFSQRLYLLDSDRYVLISHTNVKADSTLTPLLFQGKTVGYLGLAPRKIISDAPQQRFLREQKLALVLTAGVVLLLAAGLSMLLARRLVRPLRNITLATHQLAAGSFDVRLTVESRDELGQLAGDFNALAITLEKSELARRQWVADISHELRTPLAILRSETEALQDGIRQPTPEMVNSLHYEAMHLVRLVDDLYQLSLSDVGALTYRKTELDLMALLEQSAKHFQPEFSGKDIAVETKFPEKAVPSFSGDPERLQQLFSNLLDNSLKYTDSGGQLQIVLHVENGNAVIDFIDSAPTVPSQELDRLFERLYRVESSRNRVTGGAGLGLAICRNIVEAHGGDITALTSPRGGLWIRIRLPGVHYE